MYHSIYFFQNNFKHEFNSTDYYYGQVKDVILEFNDKIESIRCQLMFIASAISKMLSHQCLFAYSNVCFYIYPNIMQQMIDHCKRYYQLALEQLKSNRTNVAGNNNRNNFSRTNMKSILFSSSLVQPSHQRRQQVIPLRLANLVVPIIIAPSKYVWASNGMQPHK
jgi:hypothetical protein